MNRLVLAAALVCVCASLVFTAGAFVWYSGESTGRQGDPDPDDQPISTLAGEPTTLHGKALYALNLPGVVNPELLAVSQVTIPPSEKIIGIRAVDQYRAYVVDSLSMVTEHIVNDHIGKVPLSVSYCNLADCARVFTSDGEDIDLRVGGVLFPSDHPEMVLLIDGERYPMSAANVPLQQYSFERMTWGEWVAAHSGTKVFIGQMNRFRR